MTCYLDALSKVERSKVVEKDTKKVFKFGSGNRLKSAKQVIIPREILAVYSNLPLLLGKPSLKRAGVILDLITDEAVICGVVTQLRISRSGHYVIPLLPSGYEAKVLEDVLINISTETSKQKEKLANKLHRQLGHPSAAKLKELLKNAGLNDDILMKTIDNVSTQCDVCQRFKRTPSR